MDQLAFQSRQLPLLPPGMWSVMQMLKRPEKSQNLTIRHGNICHSYFSKYTR